MASIEKRRASDGVISYRVKVRMKGHPPETATFTRLTDAKAWAAKIESSIREGRHFQLSAAKRHTLSQLISSYRESGMQHIKNPRHRLPHLEWWDKKIGFVSLAELTPARIAKIRDQIATEGQIAWVNNSKGQRVRVMKNDLRSGATVNRYLASLSAVCTYAVKELQWLESNPVNRVRKRPESKGNERFLNQEEALSVLQNADKNGRSDFKVFVAILLTTGARFSEISKAKWKQVDFKRSVIDLSDTKNGTRRALPLVEPALSLLKTHNQTRSIDSDLIFPSPNSKLKSADYRYQWKKLKETCGLEGVRFHDMRHTAASFLIMGGAGLRTTADVLGHKTLAMVQRYSHLLDEHKNEAATKAAKAMFKIDEVKNS
ncbi:site-specific integrase [Laribacter hongkongensis]|uniref:tyrosine-type recombinase/integrase n=1 Tax=Laribacter hongkongensis TaxID=168471 RepID=UPI001EFDDBE6|nr:site-specific integrase [Laribacter hongkongensis]MCG9065045.1 site-specific integrase [Laribacter hongkongensis]